LAEYLEATWEFAPAWSLMAGVRHSEVQFDSQDHYIVPGNGDDSGQVSYSATPPVAGLLYKAQPWLNFYASYGQGFQTPIVAELAYQANGAAGPNLGLKAATSKNAEVGAKMHEGNLASEIALFQTRTNDEIVINSNTGGRAPYQNAGRTLRQGVELSLNYAFSPSWRAQFAYTYLDATYRDAFSTCIATPCTAATKVPVNAGNRLPGISRNNVYGTVRFGHEGGWYASVNAQYLTDVMANDVNTASASSYALVGADGGYRVELGSFTVNAFIRINNALDRAYVGSIIVNDTNGRFFEPGAPRAVLGQIDVAWK